MKNFFSGLCRIEQNVKSVTSEIRNRSLELNNSDVVSSINQIPAELFMLCDQFNSNEYVWISVPVCAALFVLAQINALRFVRVGKG